METWIMELEESPSLRRTAVLYAIPGIPRRRRANDVDDVEEEAPIKKKKMQRTCSL